jgi:hypothetical protein
VVTAVNVLLFFMPVEIPVANLAPEIIQVPGLDVQKDVPMFPALKPSDMNVSLNRVNVMIQNRVKPISYPFLNKWRAGNDAYYLF